MLTAHYILNVTTSDPGMLVVDGESRLDTHYTLYNNVRFEPTMWPTMEELPELVQRIARTTVEDCDSEDIYEFMETIYSTDEMTDGIDDEFIIVDGEAKSIYHLEEEHDEFYWEECGQQGAPELHKAEIVEGPLFSFESDSLNVARVTATELLFLLKI